MIKTKPIFEYLQSLIKLYAFWLLVFLYWRIAFIILNYSLIHDTGAVLSDIVPVLWHALELDMSTASYFVTIIFILQSISYFVKSNLFASISNYINYVFVFLYSLLGIGEIGLYPEWKIKVNAKALEYLHRPEEVLGSNKTLDTVWQLALLLISVVLLIFVYNKFARFKAFSSTKKSILFSPLLIILTGGIIFIAMRGGIQEIPISQSQSYYSENEVLNDICVNSAWNLAYNVVNSQKVNDVNIFKSYSPKIASQICDSLNTCEVDTTISILNQKRPNVLFIVLESWSGDLVGALGGKKGITPNFDKLTEEGLFFTNFYSNGNRSQQGLASILGGYPALPITTLTTVPEKMRKTPTITRVFNANGYSSAFYYGGELRYGNIKAYLIHNHFKEIVEDKDWDSRIPRGKLGIHDGFMFDLLEKKIESKQQPFFVTYFTLSSHSPYDQPMNPKIDWGDSEDDFHNSAYYTDSCIGRFMENAKNTDWYKNTLIVFVADHSHQTYTHRSIATAEYRKIPMLITGGALKENYRGKKYDKIASHVDIGKTVLHQLHLNADKFYWSKNLFNPYQKHFAYFELNEGFGWIRDDGYLSYNHFNKSFIFNTFKDDMARDKAHREGAAYLQEVFQEFIDL
jgi:phosphoglycerol transferase MdoB-like AlkP superfamily enzyme